MQASIYRNHVDELQIHISYNMLSALKSIVWMHFFPDSTPAPNAWHWQSLDLTDMAENGSRLGSSTQKHPENLGKHLESV